MYDDHEIGGPFRWRPGRPPLVSGGENRPCSTGEGVRFHSVDPDPNVFWRLERRCFLDLVITGDPLGWGREDDVRIGGDVLDLGDHWCFSFERVLQRWRANRGDWSRRGWDS